MIDWLSVGSNALWILGVAIMLAAWSLDSSRAPDHGESTGRRAESVATGAWTRCGAFLVCLGLATLGVTVLESALWALVAACIVGEGIVRHAAHRDANDAGRSG